MIKQLDKLVVRAFLGPFILTFAVVVFILLTQYMLKYFEDFVGKDLGLPVFGELLFYFALNMMPAALPLAILLSCLITFGNMGEFNELTAVKTSGITLPRVLAPVGIIVALLAVGVFFFNDTVVPKANLRAYSLLYDIRQKKPTLDIKPGIFYNGLPGYSVKAGEKIGDKTMKDIMIYDHTAGRGNVSLITADSGLMYTINGDRYLVLDLYKGKNYSELIENDPQAKEVVFNQFTYSRLMFSLASFDLNRTQVELFSQNRMMRNLKELRTDIDSIGREGSTITRTMPANLLGYFYYLFRPVGQAKGSNAGQVYNDSLAREASLLATNQARNVKSFTAGYVERLKTINRDRNVFTVEFKRRFTQAVACIVFFLIGAPLGAIIRKGGLGIPVLISITFFVVFYVLSITGEKWAKEGVMDMDFSMWYSNGLLAAIGLFFANQARRDSALFELDFYKRFFRKRGGRAAPR